MTDRTWAELTRMYELESVADAVVTVNEITAASVLLNSLGVQPDAGAEHLIPTDDVAYRIAAPDREPPLTAPRIDPVPGDGLRVGRTLRRHVRDGRRVVLEPPLRARRRAVAADPA